MITLADCGMDGTTLSGLSFETGPTRFKGTIPPIMIEAGLRVVEDLPAA